MDRDNKLSIRISNNGYDIYGTSFNPKEVTKEEFLSKFFDYNAIDFDGIFDDIDLDEIFGEIDFEEIAEHKNNEGIALDEKLDSNEDIALGEQLDSNEGIALDEKLDSNEAFALDEKLDSNEATLSVIDYSLGAELILNNMKLEIELDKKLIYDQNNIISQVMFIEMDKKETYKSLINQPDDHVSVLWLYPGDITISCIWNEKYDFDISKLKIYYYTRVNEVESTEYKVFSHVSYQDTEPDEIKMDGDPNLLGIQGPFTL